MRTSPSPIALPFALVFIPLMPVLFSFMLTGWTKRGDNIRELQHKCTSCAAAQQLAEEDFAKGKYRVIFWGWGMPESQIRMAELLVTDYNFIVLGGGCLQHPEWECYDQRMRHLISNKFGECFLDDVKERAKRLLVKNS